MAYICQLPTSVVNKIAAGEVIERPASAVKELLENAIDAGATRIELSLEKGGTELIRIADNGCGILPQELPLAVASHATSKIQSADELFSVQTLGFRGEALASIAEISQFTIRSRHQSEELGAELEVIGGKKGSVKPCGMAVGTTIEVRNLFYNTPVRKKYLRTVPTEMGKVTEVFQRIALPNPQIAFTLRHNGRLLYELTPSENWKDRIRAFFGEAIAETLIPIHGEADQITIHGYVADPTHHRSNNKMIHLFLNKRYIRDHSLQHAMKEAYRGLLLAGRFPAVFLQLTMPPDLVDVNVHPTKMEVRFQESGRIYSQLLSTIRKKFLTTDLTAKMGSGEEVANSESANRRFDPRPAEGKTLSGPLGEQQRAVERHQQELIEWARGEGRPTVEGRQGGAALEAHQLDSPLPEGPFSSAATTSVPSAAGEVNPQPGREEVPSSVEQSTTSLEKVSALQLHKKYLLVPCPEGMLVVDQHALHERILYEQLKEKILQGQKMEVQHLLVPEPIHLSPTEVAAIYEIRESLAEIGFLFEPFGGDTILLSSVPALMSKHKPAILLREMIEKILSGGKKPQRQDTVDELLHMMSCKAAIKTGDSLTK